MAAPQFPTKQFNQAQPALDYVTQLYDAQIAYLRDSLQRIVAGEQLPEHIRARYPFVRVHTDTVRMADSRLSYGFVAGPGTYETSLTRPDLFADYYREQFALLLSNHGVDIEVGLGADPIPVHFSLDEHQHLEGSMPPDRRLLLRDQFDLPDLGAMDDGIANGTDIRLPGQPRPLSLFSGPRIDMSLMRLKHYTGTSPHHFQNFVIFTNYQFKRKITLLHQNTFDSLSNGFFLIVCNNKHRNIWVW